MRNEAVYKPSLEGIIVGETAISNVDGAGGRLSYRGQTVEQLVSERYWSVATSLACEHAVNDGQQQQFNAFMQQNSVLTVREVEMLNALPKDLHPMLVIQSLIPALPESAGAELGLPLLASDIQHGYALAAKIPAILCAWRCRELGISQDGFSQHHDPAGQFLSNFPACDRSAEAIEVLNACQVLQMEHGFNASTFAGRVCASTDAPIQSVLSVSVGTLYGRLHGGADQAALEMAQQVACPDKAAAFVREQLANKQKIMGMGHREYKVLDPRAAVLKPMAEALCARNAEAKNLFATLVAVEQACQQEFEAKGKQIWANVEYYKGAVFHALGIPSHYFTAMFTMARVFGYLAHYEEFRRTPKLIRPTARYVGN